MIHLVSIIIPVFNCELFIAETIYSALNQTYKNIEIIIINDGSTDNSLTIAKQFESEKLKVYSQKNMGAASARNLGLKEAKGDFIQFLDADDLLAANKIETQLTQLNNHPYYISYCNSKILKNNVQDDLATKNISDILKTKTDSHDFLVHLYGGYGNPSMVPIHAWLTPRAIINIAGYWDESLTVDDDGEFFCRTVLAAQNVVFCDKTYVFYRKYEHNNNLSAQRSSKHFNSELESIRLKTQNLLLKKETQEVKIAMSFWYIRLAILSYPKFKNISSQAIEEIKILGVNPNIPIMGGAITEFFKKFFGWKFIRILQHLMLK